MGLVTTASLAFLRKGCAGLRVFAASSLAPTQVPGNLIEKQNPKATLHPHGDACDHLLEPYQVGACC